MKILVRSILKYKGLAALNVVGLAIGLATCAVIFLFVKSELSYDQFHSNGRRIYRVAHDRMTNGQSGLRVTTPIALAPFLKEIRSVEKTARFLRDGGGIVRFGDKENAETQFCFVDAAAFEMFDFKVVSGSLESVTDSSNNLVFTASVAKKYFGAEDPVGKIIQYRNWGQQYTYQVGAVVEDLPENSHFRFEIFAPFESRNNLWNSMHGSDWFYSGAWTYVLLKNGADAVSIDADFKRIISTHMPPELQKATSFFLQPMTRIYLDSNLAGEIEVNGDRSYVVILAVIGVFILLLACINFVNLSTARAAERGREVGVRKVLGAFKSQLIGQFLGETVVVAAVSTFIALMFVPLILPSFNFITGRNLHVNYFGDPALAVILIVVGVMTGLAAGIYPAFRLSSFKPASVLRMSGSFGSESHGTLRRVLVGVQFTTALMLLVGVFTISSQLAYIRNIDLGFNRNQIIFIQGFDFRKAKQLKHHLEEVPGVTEMTTTRGVPGSLSAGFDTRLFQTNKLEATQRMEAYYTSGDYDFLNFFGIELVNGRKFSREFIADSAESIMVNEMFVKKSGWEDDPLDKQIAIFDMLGNPAGVKRVVGVFKDFNFQTLHNDVKPMALGLTSRSWNLAFRIASDKPFKVIDQVKSAASAYANETPIDAYFLDEDMGRQYLKEERLSAMIYWLASLAVVIACMGLFGLSSFSAQRKSKEIAIRKVFGASVLQIVARFNYEFVVLICISFVVSIPVAYLLLEQWLETFAYRISQGAFIYGCSFLLALLMACLTVSFYSLRASIANPINSLKED
jgi:putative ABC transport system permease protein